VFLAASLNQLQEGFVKPALKASLNQLQEGFKKASLNQLHEALEAA
jgi:hypothetical protein